MSGNPVDVDVVVVGAGIAGLYLVHRLRAIGLRVVAFERGEDVGGTWYWNRYPGARCDVPSVEYSYSFSDELADDWQWTERYAAQPELLAYLRHVADRFDLRRDIRLGTEVLGATWYADHWRVDTRTTDGTRATTARFVVLASGGLSEPVVPPLPGLDEFAGRVLLTARWPQEPVDFDGARVGVIGTGSSGVQVITALAPVAARLTVFQRTPNYTVPAQNRPLAQGELDAVRARYPHLRTLARESNSGFAIEPPTRSVHDVDDAEVETALHAQWAFGGPTFMAAFKDLRDDPDGNRLAADFVRARIAETVTDPSRADLLMPRDHPIGAKRLCIDTGYYEVFNRPNVDLIDLRSDPIVMIEPHGLRLGMRSIELDTLVFATGFDAVTGAVTRMDIVGRDGVSLAKTWADGPRAYLGLMTAGFPNLFLVTGPSSPSVLSNVIVSIEQHVEWIADCLADLRASGRTGIETTEQAQDEWGRHADEVAAGTVFPTTSSWYVGANVPGKARRVLPYVGGVGRYRRICAEVAEAGYRGFTTW